MPSSLTPEIYEGFTENVPHTQLGNQDVNRTFCLEPDVLRSLSARPPLFWRAGAIV
jgi:hypothetical protein